MTQHASWAAWAGWAGWASLAGRLDVCSCAWAGCAEMLAGRSGWVGWANFTEKLMFALLTKKCIVNLEEHGALIDLRARPPQVKMGKI